MKNHIEILKYYEQIEKTDVTLLVDKSEIFRYVSKTSIHSEVTDWAYGEDGRLLWALVAEEVYHCEDPFSPPEKLRRRRCLVHRRHDVKILHT